MIGKLKSKKRAWAKFYVSKPGVLQIRKYCLLFAFTLLHLFADAQNYSFHLNNKTYNQLEGASLVSNNFNSQSYWAVNVDFNITLFGRNFDFSAQNDLLIAGNGFIASAYYADSTDVTVNGFLADLKSRPVNSGIYMKVEGSPGSKILKIEWRNVGFENGDGSDSISFQIWLYEEGAGDIELVYGDGNVASAALGGLSGPGIGFYLFSLKKANIGEKLHGYFLEDDSSFPTFTEYLGSGVPRIEGVPFDGASYRFANDELASVSEVISGSVVAYPNPTDNIVYFSGELVELSLRDQSGREVMHLTRTETVGLDHLELGELPVGVYFLEGRTTENGVIRQRILKL